MASCEIILENTNIMSESMDSGPSHEVEEIPIATGQNEDIIYIGTVSSHKRKLLRRNPLQTKIARRMKLKEELIHIQEATVSERLQADKEKERLEQMLEEEKEKKEEAERKVKESDCKIEELSTALEESKKMIDDFEDAIGTEFQCTICCDLLIEPVVLKCSHAFCSYCLRVWWKNKNSCPTCRSTVTCHNRYLALDNFILRMIDSLSESFKTRTLKAIEERKAATEELNKNESAQDRSNAERGPTDPQYDEVARIRLAEDSANQPTRAYANRPQIVIWMANGRPIVTSGYDPPTPPQG